MSSMINLGSELLRVNPTNNQKLEYSKNNGQSWNTRFSGNSTVGSFESLTQNGAEILGATSKGLFYSKNKGQSWNRRSS